MYTWYLFVKNIFSDNLNYIIWFQQDGAPYTLMLKYLCRWIRRREAMEYHVLFGQFVQNESLVCSFVINVYNIYFCLVLCQ